MCKKSNLKKDNNLNPYIFNQKTNNSSKLIPFNALINEIGGTKYLPPVSKEWKNSVYTYLKKNSIDYPVYDLKINSLIRGYFSLYFNNKYIVSKYISRKKKLKSFNRIFVSKAEIKHTNDKAIITLYIYNRERSALLKKIRKLKNLLLSKKIFNSLGDKWLKFISMFTNNILVKKDIKYLFFFFKYKLNRPFVNSMYFIRHIHLAKKIKKTFLTIRRLRLRLSLNKNKFEDKFLFKLSKLIGKYYGKKVEFNIVNLKKASYNSDIFTELLTMKLKKPKANVIFVMNLLLAKISLRIVNRIAKSKKMKKEVNYDLLANKFKNPNLNFILNKFYSPLIKNASSQLNRHKENLNKLLYSIYSNAISDNTKDKLSSLYSQKTAYYLKLRDIVLESIKYKYMGGARLIVKGRLTRRYRADRAVDKLKWKGGLKNLESCYRGLPLVVYRGYLNSGVVKSLSVSKRRIGSFAVKGWFNGK